MPLLLCFVELAYSSYFRVPFYSFLAWVSPTVLELVSCLPAFLVRLFCFVFCLLVCFLLLQIMAFAGSRLARVRSVPAHAGVSQGLDIDPCNR